MEQLTYAKPPILGQIVMPAHSCRDLTMWSPRRSALIRGGARGIFISSDCPLLTLHQHTHLGLVICPQKREKQHQMLAPMLIVVMHITHDDEPV